jgi:hypothetical protein
MEHINLEQCDLYYLTSMYFTDTLWAKSLGLDTLCIHNKNSLTMLRHVVDLKMP